MAEGVRWFPGMEPDRIRGKEAIEWWREVRERQLASPTGTLVVDPGDDGVSVFLQEGYVGRGLTTKAGLPPGTYRVYTERAEVSGRVHSVDVRAGEVTRLVLDWKFDSTLHTGSWVGFAYESPVEHRERRGRDAGRIATLLQEPYAILVGLSSRGDGRYVFGLAVSHPGRCCSAARSCSTTAPTPRPSCATSRARSRCAVPPSPRPYPSRESRRSLSMRPATLDRAAHGDRRTRRTRRARSQALATRLASRPRPRCAGGCGKQRGVSREPCRRSHDAHVQRPEGTGHRCLRGQLLRHGSRSLPLSSGVEINQRCHGCDAGRRCRCIARRRHVVRGRRGSVSRPGVAAGILL